ncbi:uncharacterized protein J3D65DRAFT_690864 [Phyllosticta citribraziliensis]|uniref:Uncharacterized protein n=1 Tax=Phyllosticta citribraziliensis TaxID=989973 RepID=A0ABR1M6Q9_9PEZI
MPLGRGDCGIVGGLAIFGRGPLLLRSRLHQASQSLPGVASPHDVARIAKASSQSIRVVSPRPAFVHGDSSVQALGVLGTLKRSIAIGGGYTWLTDGRSDGTLHVGGRRALKRSPERRGLHRRRTRLHDLGPGQLSTAPATCRPPAGAFPFTTLPPASLLPGPNDLRRVGRESPSEFSLRRRLFILPALRLSASNGCDPPCCPRA